MLSVLFDFTAEESLELSVRVGELVEIVWEGSDGDTGDGWIKVKNNKGSIGFVPKDYLESIPVQKSHSSPISHQVGKFVTNSAVAAFVDLRISQHALVWHAWLSR